MGLSFEQWLVGTENGNDRKWYALEMEKTSITKTMNIFRNKTGRTPVSKPSPLPDGRVHLDICISPDEFALINSIIDEYIIHHS